eukprot:40703_1
MLFLVIFYVCAIQNAFGGGSTSSYDSSKPNIIFILSDDQDLTLDSMQAMPNVKSLIADKGLTFSNAFAHTPVCCPSRTEIVAGRTYHNVQYPKPTCQGVAADYNVYENPDALFPKFHTNGYNTAGFGKVTNDWSYMCESSFNLESFDRVHVSCNYKEFFTEDYFNKYLGELSGQQARPSVSSPDEYYQTAQLGNASVIFIQEELQKQARGDSDAKPFFMWIAPYAPHSPADPSPWYEDRYGDLELLRTDNYNCDTSNYHRPLSDNPPITSDAEQFMLLLYKDRLRSLLSIDDMVKGIIDVIDDENAWDNTYLIYTSDHGYHIGQYRLPCEKYQPYEETVRVPFYIRGKDIPSGQITEALISHIDLVPTLLDLANISYSVYTYDGRSYREILENGASYNYNDEWRQMLMFEYKTIKGTEDGAGFSSCAMWGIDSVGIRMPDLWKLDNMYNSWRIIRIKNASVDWFYGEFVDMEYDENAFENPIFHEFYDIEDDPYQLKNLYIDSNRNERYLTDDFFNGLHELIMKYGQCEGADNCSPIGSIYGDSSTGSTYGDSESSNSKGGGKSKAMIEGISMDRNNFGYGESVNNGLTPANISLVISCALIIGILSLFIGMFIGKKLNANIQAEMVMHIPKDL